MKESDSIQLFVKKKMGAHIISNNSPSCMFSPVCSIHQLANHVPLSLVYLQIIIHWHVLIARKQQQRNPFNL